MVVEASLLEIIDTTNITLCIKPIQHALIPRPNNDTVLKLFCVKEQRGGHHLVAMKRLTMCPQKLIFLTQVFVLKKLSYKFILFFCAYDL